MHDSINYLDYGVKTKDAIVLLHGWGQNIEMMRPIGDAFASDKRVIIIDLPGFGKSIEPTYVWSLIDYVNCIHDLLTNLDITSFSLIGHSFGGKIALLYASIYGCDKLVCLSSPFKKKVLKDSFKTKMLKQAKKIPVIKNLEGFAKKHIGSTDYKNASEMMRKIMVEHVNFDICEYVKKINCPTLIIWGTNDLAVSVDDAYELKELIKDSGIVTYEGCSHYAYLERIDQTNRILKSFLGDE